MSGVKIHRPVANLSGFHGLTLALTKDKVLIEIDQRSAWGRSVLALASAEPKRMRNTVDVGHAPADYVARLKTDMIRRLLWAAIDDGASLIAVSKVQELPGGWLEAVGLAVPLPELIELEA